MLLSTKKKRNIELNFYKDLLNMIRKINKRGKDKIICTVCKIEKNPTIFTILIVNSMASHLYNLLQLFSKVFHEI